MSVFCEPCSRCSKTSRATHQCHDCQEPYCVDCSEQHIKFRVLKRHKIVPLVDQQQQQSRARESVTNMCYDLGGDQSEPVEKADLPETKFIKEENSSNQGNGRGDCRLITQVNTLDLADSKEEEDDDYLQPIATKTIREMPYAVSGKDEAEEERHTGSDEFLGDLTYCDVDGKPI